MNSFGAVLYAKDLSTLSAFYAAVAGLEIQHAEHGSVVLASPALQLFIVAIPADIAAGITITQPPARRSDTPMKLVFPVPDIAAARREAVARGGSMVAAQAEWSFLGHVHCDGVDPEGNVFQVRRPEETRPLSGR